MHWLSWEHWRRRKFNDMLGGRHSQALRTQSQSSGSKDHRWKTVLCRRHNNKGRCKIMKKRKKRGRGRGRGRRRSCEGCHSLARILTILCALERGEARRDRNESTSSWLSSTTASRCTAIFFTYVQICRGWSSGDRWIAEWTGPSIKRMQSNCWGHFPMCLFPCRVAHIYIIAIWNDDYDQSCNMNRTTTNLAPLATHMIPFIYHDLATCFYVRGLAAIQIARLLERVLLLSEMCTWKAEECSYVGERARISAQRHLFPHAHMGTTLVALTRKKVWGSTTWCLHAGKHARHACNSTKPVPSSVSADSADHWMTPCLWTHILMAGGPAQVCSWVTHSLARGSWVTALQTCCPSQCCAHCESAIWRDQKMHGMSAEISCLDIRAHAATWPKAHANANANANDSKCKCKDNMQMHNMCKFQMTILVAQVPSSWTWAWHGMFLCGTSAFLWHQAFLTWAWTWAWHGMVLWHQAFLTWAWTWAWHGMFLITMGLIIVMNKKFNMFSNDVCSVFSCLDTDLSQESLQTTCTLRT